DPGASPSGQSSHRLDARVPTWELRTMSSAPRKGLRALLMLIAVLAVVPAAQAAKPPRSAVIAYVGQNVKGVGKITRLDRLEATPNGGGALSDYTSPRRRE